MVEKNVKNLNKVREISREDRIKETARKKEEELTLQFQTWKEVLLKSSKIEN